MLVATFRLGGFTIEKNWVQSSHQWDVMTTRCFKVFEPVVTPQMKDNVVPFMIGVHCFVH
jgi:hypothetical protein